MSFSSSFKTFSPGYIAPRRAHTSTKNILLSIQEGHGCIRPCIAFVFAFSAVQDSLMQEKKRKVSTNL